jgi:hypothetical protein
MIHTVTHDVGIIVISHQGGAWRGTSPARWAAAAVGARPKHHQGRAQRTSGVPHVLGEVEEDAAVAAVPDTG